MAKPKKPLPPEFLAFASRPLLGAPWTALAAAAWGVAVLAAFRADHLPFLSPSYWLSCVPPVWLMSATAAERHLGHLFYLALFTALSLLLGRGLLRRAFKIEGLNVFETLSYGFGLGLGAVSLATFALGAAQALRPAPVYALTAALAGLALWLNRGLAAPAPEKRIPVLDGPACVVMAAATALILAFECFHGLAPEISFDALVYHLGLPGLFRANGGLSAAPTVAYSGFPMLVEWAYAWMLFFSDEISAKLIHWACGVGVAAAFVGLGARMKRPLAGWIACVAFLGMSMTVYNVTKAAVDAASAFFTILTIASLALHLSRREASPEDTGALDLSAALCGLALGIKYTNWPLLPLLLVLLAALGEPRRRVLRYAFVASALLAPWIVKNLVLYRNPVFPFLNELFSPHAPYAPAWRKLRADAWGRDWPALLSGGPGWKALLLHPWLMSVGGSTEFDAVGPVFALGLTGLLWLRPASAESRLWLWAVFGLWLSWWTASSMPRFFLPGLGLLSVFVGVALERVPHRALRAGLLALLLGLALDAVADFSGTTSQTGSMEYLLGGAPKDAYLGRTRRVYPGSYYKAADWINRNAPAGARVLVLNGGRGYYLERPFLTSSQLDEDLLAHWLKSGGGAEDLAAEFRRAGVSSLLVNMGWLWRTDPDPGVTPERQTILQEFFDRHARLRFHDLEKSPEEFRWVLVYDIGSEMGPPPKAVVPLVEWYRVGGASGLAAQPRITIE